MTSMFGPCGKVLAVGSSAIPTKTRRVHEDECDGFTMVAGAFISQVPPSVRPAVSEVACCRLLPV
jgi:hypothetical protein